MSDVLFGVLDFTICPFAFALCFVGHPGLAAAMRASIVGRWRGRRSYWSFCPETWSPELGRRGPEFSLR